MSSAIGIGFMTVQNLHGEEKTQASKPLTLIHRDTFSASIKGHFNHFTVDAKGKRLFGTAVEDKVIVVFDLSRGVMTAAIKGIDEPRGVLYRPDLCDSTCVAQLGTFYDSAPRSTLVGGVRHLVITPYQDMDHAVAVVAWGYIDEMDQMDPDRVMADFKSKVDATTAPERGAL